MPRPTYPFGDGGRGQYAFIGAVHRIAAHIDDRFELIAGALSSTPERSQASGEAIDLSRIYDDFKQMAMREARRKDGIEAVAIVTPSHVHYAVAREYLKRGVHVICDKPLTSTLADAKKLVKAAETSDALFVLTHKYTGYPMIRQARAMIAAGDIGPIRVVQVEYAQDWLTENETFKQAEWRADPDRSGAGGSTGDIGTHAFNLACFVTGLEVDSLAADLQAFVPGRRVDDNAHVMLRFCGGARGMLWASQVAPGNENCFGFGFTVKKAVWNGPKRTPIAFGIRHLVRRNVRSPETGQARGRRLNGSVAFRPDILRDTLKGLQTSTPKRQRRSSHIGTVMLRTRRSRTRRFAMG
jgi:predicted dehydrogenase